MSEEKGADRRHNDPGAKCRAIIDDAIAELLMLPMESRDAAASMMACQAIARIEDNEVCRRVAQFAAESVWDIDDTNQ
jgi:hypothetical protein